jgi:hypothetical protein
MADNSLFILRQVPITFSSMILRDIFRLIIRIITSECIPIPLSCFNSSIMIPGSFFIIQVCSHGLFDPIKFVVSRLLIVLTIKFICLLSDNSFVVKTNQNNNFSGASMAIYLIISSLANFFSFKMAFCCSV